MATMEIEMRREGIDTATSFGNSSLHEQLVDARGRNSHLESQVERGITDLTQAVDELEAFAYNVSHDLRAPLRAISGFSEILMRDQDPALDPRSSRYLNRIYQNCRHMGALIDDLLEFSRMGRVDVVNGRVDVSGLVRTAMQELHESADEDLPTVEVADLPSCVGDWRLLKQVFKNLLSNAIKYSHTSSPPRITVGIVAASPGEVVYTVTDNGVGFDMEYADQLFQVFQRLHRAEDYEGTGVGLALCQRIVRRHGGRIWAHAEIDQGATFYVALPSGEAS